MPISRILFRALIVLPALLAPLTGQAAHPLITEDTGTQGQGHFQFELTSEHATLRQNGANQAQILTSAVFAYGVVDSTDVILTLPYLRFGQSATGGAHGPTDVGLDVKWRFYEKHQISFAFKPGVTFPTGDETRSLGSGRSTWSAYVTASHEVAPWTWHLHFGHVHHNNTSSEREDIWHASTAVVRQIGDTLKLVLDLGFDTNTDRNAKEDPVFLIAGFIYSPHRDVDIDVGYKTESTDSLRTRTLLTGFTLRW